MPLFLHTADWQIGRQYGQFEPDDAIPLAEARFAAVERLAILAVEHKVDAVLVAGDVFDTQTVSDRTVRRLFNTLSAFQGPWIMIPGNHDAALAESVWTRATRLGAIPANVRVVLEPQALAFPDGGFVILAAPLTQRHTYTDLTEWFDAEETAPGLFRIGLAHGSVQGILAEDIDSTNPIAPDRAARARLDYFALGDWHGTKRIDARTWYCGTPEPERFRANDAGQALLIEIESTASEPRVSAIPTGQYRWQALSQVITVPSDVDKLLAGLDQVGAGDVVDLTLSGQVDLGSHQRIRAAMGQFEARARSFRVELSALRLSPTAEDIAALKADGYLGEVIAELRDQQGDEAGIAEDALEILTGLLAEGFPQGSSA